MSQPFQTSTSYRPPLYNQSSSSPNSAPLHPSQLDEILNTNKQIIVALNGMQSTVQLVNTHSQSIAKIETQLGKLATSVNQHHKRDMGKLPSKTVLNSKGQFVIDEPPPPSGPHHEQIYAITTLRSGRVADNKVGEETEILAPKDSSPPKNLKISPKIPNSLIPSIETSYEPKGPYPQRLKEFTHFRNKGCKIQDMLEVFRQVKINIPLLDAIQQIPPYAKFLKDLCTQKRIYKSNIPKRVRLTKQDPGAPIISCVIGDNEIEKTLTDLRASVNLILYSLYLQLGLGDLKPTLVVLQLTDRSIKQPRGIIEGVIIKVDKFYFLVDFLVLDTEPVHNPKNHILVILGRPFLATTNALINYRTGVMNISFGNTKVKLNIFNASQHPLDENECFTLDTSDELVKDSLLFIPSQNVLEIQKIHDKSDKVVINELS
ncbi:uncharacterized protein LOC132313816 [Cornus florida]|uniref:uncharacterized protein LOC132313816 n=1 Tax=Cornus florida TaxID=4283 RepID=UPI00289B0760|nr:uncharacterized protein LOC132313816 [Cornus florida]